MLGLEWRLSIEGSWLNSRQNFSDIPLTLSDQPAAHLVAWRDFFRVVKRPKSEAYSSSAEIKKAWSSTSTSSYICSWRGHFLALRIRYILFFNKIGQFTIKIFNHVTLSQVTKVTELLLIEIINVNINNYGKFRMLDLNHKDKALFIIATEHPSSESGIKNCVCAFDMIGIIKRTFGISSADLKSVRGL